MFKNSNLTTHFVFTVAAENKKIQQGNGVVHVNSFNWRTAGYFFFFFLQSWERKRSFDRVTWCPSRDLQWPAEREEGKKANVLLTAFEYRKWLKDFYCHCLESHHLSDFLKNQLKAHQNTRTKVYMWCKTILFVYTLITSQAQSSNSNFIIQPATFHLEKFRIPITLIWKILSDTSFCNLIHSPYSTLKECSQKTD